LEECAQTFFSCPEDGGSMILQNNGKNQPITQQIPEDNNAWSWYLCFHIINDQYQTSAQF
jgi:hypothetical protein